jgi:hypothetical protein
MQASLAVVSFLFGTLAWWQTGRIAFLVGAIVLLANWPYTLFGIMATNRRPMATEPSTADAQSRALMQNWGRLHTVRTALGFGAVMVFVWALLT